MNRSLICLTLGCAVLIGTLGLSLGAPGLRRSEQRGAAAYKDDYHRPRSIPSPAGAIDSSTAIDLGRTLFNDPRFSRSGTTSCATCHVADLAWGDGRPRAVGDGGAVLPRRSPTLLNLAWGAAMGWAGQFPDLDSVTFGALEAADNMGATAAEVMAKLSADPAYTTEFAAAFPGDGITKANFEAAVSAYERTLVSGEAPFDRWIEGDDRAIDDAAKHGFALFNGKAGCSGCHAGWNFTDGSYHDVGTASGADLGRGALYPDVRRLQYAFKVPTLRDLKRRGPYMHDGSIPTLPKVVELYDRGGIDRASRSTQIRPLGLTAPEKAALLAFLETLNASD